MKNLYCADDRLGINSTFLFSFQCSDSTVKKIIDTLQLHLITNNEPGGLDVGSAYPWWDSASIEKIQPYTRIDKRLSWYLWHDKKTAVVYFETFDE